VSEAKKGLESKKTIEVIKQELLKRKAELEEQLAALYTEKVVDDQAKDIGDQTMSSMMETLRNSLQDSEIHEYNRIIRALQMIEDGTYGVCVDCGQPISEKRLKSYPNATRCLACQELFEERGS
jgi:DnaK suppressor protein